MKKRIVAIMLIMLLAVCLYAQAVETPVLTIKLTVPEDTKTELSSIGMEMSVYKVADIVDGELEFTESFSGMTSGTDTEGEAFAEEALGIVLNAESQPEHEVIKGPDYSLGNFVSNMNFLNEVIEGMASFTIEKTVKDGQTSIRILDETVKPMIMHYDQERKNPAVYMLDDYTEELAAEHGTSQYSGEVTLEIIRSRFDEIVNAGVETSPAIDLLDKHFDWDGNMY